MKVELQWVCNELISAVATGGAQGLAIITLVWLALKCCSNANAATRHAAWLGTLIVVTLLPVVLFAAAVREKWPATAVAEAPLPELETYTAETPLTEGPVAEAVFVADVEAATSGYSAPWNWAITLPENVSLGFVIVWSALAVTRIAGLASQLCFLRKLKWQSAEAGALSEGFAAVVASMRLSRKPRLLISDRSPAPMVVGFLRPAMLLPKFVAEQANARQLEHLFRHELAHLARRDDWTNLVQQIIAAIFFFHPGILFLSRRLTAEREIACDDHALSISRAPREYALFLTEFASQMKGRDFTAAPAAWSRKSQLKERIGMILNGKRNASPRVSRAGVGAITAAALGLAVAALIATPRLVVAADEPEAPRTQSEPQIASNVELAVAALPPTAPIKVHVPEVIVNVDTRPAKVAPVPPRIVVAAAPAPEPAPRPRIKSSQRADGDGDGDGDDHGDRDLNRRIDRLERMVEDLLRREKQMGGPNPNAKFKSVPQEEVHAHIRTEIENAHREADRARREVERSMRDQQRSAVAHAHASAQGERVAKMAHSQSLKARKQSLEERRKQLEKELQAIEKEIEREEKGREKSEKDAEKEDKKDREKNKPDADAKDFKPRQ